MALQRTKLADIQYLPATVGSLYANPASSTTFVRGFILHNAAGVTASAKLHNVPDAAGVLGSAGTGNAFLDIDLVAGETVLVDSPYAIVLSDENDAIFGVTDTGSAVTIQILGDVDA